MVNVELSYWLGGVVTAVSVVLFAFWTRFSGRADASKISYMASGISLALCISTFGMLVELGAWPRSGDSVETNFVRAGVFAGVMFFHAIIDAKYLWHETVLGWSLLVTGGVAGSLLIFCGVNSGNERWFMLVMSAIAGAVVLAIKLAQNQLDRVPKEYDSYKLWGNFYAFASTAVYAAYGIVFFLGPEMAEVITADAREWAYMAVTISIELVLAFALWTYRSVPLSLVNEGYAPVPTAVAPPGTKEGQKSA